MLILTRRARQSVMIGDNVEITVLKVGREKVKIGIAAPRDIAVHREEMYQRTMEKSQKVNSNTHR